jgi:hypothetical protein
MSKNVALLLVFVFLAASCLIMVNLVAVTSQDTTLGFLTDVAGVDVAKYRIEETGVPSKVLGGVVDQRVKYRFEVDGSKMEVISNLKNGVLVWCKIYRLEGLPILKISSADALDSAINLMSRYHSVSKASYLQPMQDSLNALTELENMTTKIGNMKLEVKNEGNYSWFFWTDTVNGIEIPQKSIGLTFYNGAFETFGDHWNVYTVGNADVKFDREEAIQVAKELARNYSYNIGDMVVSNLTILDDYTTTRLTMQDREKNCVVYPWWEIRLPLDKVYPGAVTEIRVNMWADTGEVTYLQALR